MIFITQILHVDEVVVVEFSYATQNTRKVELMLLKKMASKSQCIFQTTVADKTCVFQLYNCRHDTNTDQQVHKRCSGNVLRLNGKEERGGTKKKNNTEV